MLRKPKEIEKPLFLSGWKEIASYLGKGVRTVQRYERRLGLPIRRPAGTPTGSVVATRSELDAWVSASPIRAAFRLTSLPQLSFPSASAQTRQGVAEMRRLRDQLAEVRIELTASVHAVQQSIEQLRSLLEAHRLQRPVVGLKVLGVDSGTERLLQLLAPEGRRRNVS